MDKLEAVQKVLRFSDTIREWCEQEKNVYFDDFDSENVNIYDKGGYGELADEIIEKGVKEGLIEEGEID
ncbi:MAG: hypothetical protein IIA62_05850 [Nitrospinae bacterium]|nr:hypothetical protein [Nitrospinota bacterium]